MRKFAVLLFFFIVLLVAPTAFADLAAIHASALPQETAVLAALDDAKTMEPYSHSWTQNWKYEISKDEVAAHLGKDLGFLSLAAKKHPENAELALLTGLVAHYAYNVDVTDSYDAAVGAFAEAIRANPSDLRGHWFRASMLCQTNTPKAGADEFLLIEGSHAWDQLPAAFWDDYMECATVTSMPAHVLRAADYLTQLHAPDSSMRAFLVETAHTRFDAYDPKKQYEPKEVWSGANFDTDPEFTSTSCGLRIRTHGDWKVNQLALDKGSCVAYLGTGPYKGSAHKLSPSIMVLVKQPEGKQTLQEFAAKYTTDGTFEPETPVRCPAENCIAMKAVQQGMYKKDGDGHGHIVVFERDQPEFPGLIFESPLEIPKSDGTEGMKFYRPRQTQQRIPGKLYYLVLLDTAASIEEPAMKDFDFFLQNLTVE